MTANIQFTKVACALCLYKDKAVIFYDFIIYSLNLKRTRDVSYFDLYKMCGCIHVILLGFMNI